MLGSDDNRESHIQALYDFPDDSKWQKGIVLITLDCIYRNILDEYHHKLPKNQYLNKVYLKIRTKTFRLFFIKPIAINQILACRFKYFNFLLKKSTDPPPKVCLRRTCRIGGKLFADYDGQTTPITNAITGKTRDAYLFMATPGTSNHRAGPSGRAYP
jgi:hypothetical protein